MIDCPWPLKQNLTDEPPAQIKYAHLWNTLHKAEGTRWEDNPRVVAITFTVHRTNVGSVLDRDKGAA